MSTASIIAIVDDDPDVRRSLDSLLRSAGKRSLGFASAEKLLACHVQARLTCIVTDLHMPDMSGLELQAEIAKRGWSLPIILMTAYPTDGAQGQALGAGAAAFLTKPIDPDRFLEAIEEAVKCGSPHRQ